MLKIGVFGVGHLGKIHLKCLRNTPFEISGIYDPDEEKAIAVAKEFNVQKFDSPSELIAQSNAVDIVSTTSSHFDLAKSAIGQSKHTFIEKPVTSSLEEANELNDLADKKDVKIQIGHVERFNPAFVSFKENELQPLFIEGHRLSAFSTRGADVSVVLDLMIHDIDLILSLIPYKVKNIYANGVGVINDLPDICNARIEFENGSVANLTASRISLKQMRKLRFFQKDAYVSIDFLKKESQIVKLKDPNPGVEGMLINTNKGDKILHLEHPKINEFNAIQKELEDFHEAIVHDLPTPVNLKDGVKALELAIRIDEIIMNNLKDQSII